MTKLGRLVGYRKIRWLEGLSREADCVKVPQDWDEQDVSELLEEEEVAQWEEEEGVQRSCDSDTALPLEEGWDCR